MKFIKIEIVDVDAKPITRGAAGFTCDPKNGNCSDLGYMEEGENWSRWNGKEAFEKRSVNIEHCGRNEILLAVSDKIKEMHNRGDL